MESLPLELWLHEILPRLDKRDIIRLSCVNRKWRENIKNKYFDMFFTYCQNCARICSKYLSKIHFWVFYCSEGCYRNKWKQRSLFVNLSSILYFMPIPGVTNQCPSSDGKHPCSGKCMYCARYDFSRDIEGFHVGIPLAIDNRVV
jgi:hypothetical protein